jgi:Xaa-Pro aminopeptidase
LINMKLRRLVPVCVSLLLFSQLGTSLERQSNADYHARREALAKKLNNGVLILFAPMEAEGPNALYGFRQDENFYYLSGWPDPGAALVIAPATEASNEQPARAYTEIFFLPAHNTVEEKWTGPKLGPENPDAKKITGFDRVEPLDKMRDDVLSLLPTTGRSSIYSDLPEYGGGESASAGPLDWLKRANAFPGFVAFQDVKSAIASLRMFKDAGEMDLLKKAADASVAAHMAAMRAMKPGMNEREISALMQYEFGKRGCERPAYSPIVGSGFNSTVLHYSDDSATMKAGDVAVLDVGGEYSMYATDITRTLPVNGKFTARQREIYEVVLGAQQAAVEAFQSGKSLMKGKEDPASLGKVAYDYINSHGKDLHGQPLGKYFIHGLGHFVGLNVHDPGDYNLPLGPGVVFTIEPGIYIPEEKLGVRVEDTFAVDKDGKLMKLSGAIPSKPEDVEAAMAGASRR